MTVIEAEVIEEDESDGGRRRQVVGHTAPVPWRKTVADFLDDVEDLADKPANRGDWVNLSDEVTKRPPGWCKIQDSVRPALETIGL